MRLTSGVGSRHLWEGDVFTGEVECLAPVGLGVLEDAQDDRSGVVRGGNHRDCRKTDRVSPKFR